MMPVTLRGIRKQFDSTVAVDNVHLDITAGDLFFLLGPSGCGKTTLLRVIAGFTQPTAGSVVLGDRDVTHLLPNQRNCAMVFQSYALWPHMTVAQNVAFGLGVRRLPAADKRARVVAALERAQIASLADRKPNQLSGGQQQRVALARALIVEPSVLLLDEPLSNLDAKLRVEMRGHIRNVCKKAGTTAIYVTHDQNEALSMADRVAVLSKGQVVQVDEPCSLYTRPHNRFVAEFVGRNNILSGRVTECEGGMLTVESDAGTCTASLPEGLEVSVGHRLDLVVSADVITVSDTKPEADNVIVCSLISEEFIGSVVTLFLETEGGVEFKAQIQQREIENLDLRSSALFFLSWPTTSVHVLPE